MIVPKINPQEAKKELAKRHLSDFVKEFWSVIIPEDIVWSKHLDVLCDEMEAIIKRVSKTSQKGREKKLEDVLINIPPGSTKSTICTVMAPAWAWVVDPTLRIMTVSYAQSLSTDHALKSRDIIRSAKFRAWFGEIEMKSDQDNKTHYKNSATGERYATSVGGTVTGFHAHLIIIDDPVNTTQAVSEAELATANNFINTGLSQRKVDKSITTTVMIMQRLSEMDPSGNWLKKKNKRIRHICLPAKLLDNVRPPELREIYTNGYLDPIRLGQDVLDEAKIDLGSYGYAGQMDQNPAPADGGIWQNWFIPVNDHELPRSYEMENYGTDWDTAYTEKPENASSAFVCSGIFNDKMYIDNIGWFNEEFPKLIKEMRNLPDPHYVEAKASGKSACQTLKSMGIAAKEVQVNGDKIARARDATPKAEAGMVYVKRSLIDALLYDDVQGVLKFPNGQKQDLADTLSQAIQRHFARVRKEQKVFTG